MCAALTCGAPAAAARHPRRPCSAGAARTRGLPQARNRRPPAGGARYKTHVHSANVHSTHLWRAGGKCQASASSL
ncbi:unnamed protein product [Parnassius apollo]|uniref:(apollo) hypothetical protein n=1 Tax=Parnassius apollo TaxID=110799 RepID=A0A8S3W5X9_PARAO|nr:unnamed protein product [Parnassius apollo]